MRTTNLIDMNDDLKHISQKTILEVREQIQEDIRTCMEGMWNMDEKHLIEDMLCQITVDNFKKL